MTVEALKHLDKYEEQIVDKLALQETRGNSVMASFYYMKQMT